MASVWSKLKCLITILFTIYNILETVQRSSRNRVSVDKYKEKMNNVTLIIVCNVYITNKVKGISILLRNKIEYY